MEIPKGFLMMAGPMLKSLGFDAQKVEGLLEQYLDTFKQFLNGLAAMNKKQGEMSRLLMVMDGKLDIIMQGSDFAGTTEGFYKSVESEIENGTDRDTSVTGTALVTSGGTN